MVVGSGLLERERERRCGVVVVCSEALLLLLLLMVFSVFHMVMSSGASSGLWRFFHDDTEARLVWLGWDDEAGRMSEAI